MPNETLTDKAPVNMSKGYTFRLRQHLDGNFHGLWELVMLNDRGRVVKVIADANALNYCIDDIGGELEAEGF